MTKVKIRKKVKLSFVAKIAIFIMLISGGFLVGVNYEQILAIPKFFSSRRFIFEEIQPNYLSDLLANKDFTLINVHTPYSGEILKTDAFIPYDEMVANIDKLPQDKDAPIVLYCQSGNMSGTALKTLKNMGYTNVAHLTGGMLAWEKVGFGKLDLSNLSQEVLPEGGFELPVSWGNIGSELVDLGVIDKVKFSQAVEMSDEDKAVFAGTDGKITINAKNSQFVVDMLWALGLAQKSKVYDEGPMGTEYKSTAGNFASTGGWTLARGDAMDYYNRFNLIDLSPEEHDRVMDIASHIFRPCCGNHTAFPDCNHGMAALAAIELMVDAGISDGEIFKNILKLNSFWFGSTYLTSATYFARQGISWNEVDAKEVLGYEYSSSQGAQAILAKVNELPYKQNSGGGGCGA